MCLLVPLQLVAKVVALLDALAQHRRHVVVTWVGVVRNENAEAVQTLVHATIALLPLRLIGLVLLVGVRCEPLLLASLAEPGATLLEVVDADPCELRLLLRDLASDATVLQGLWRGAQPPCRL